MDPQPRGRDGTGQKNRPLSATAKGLGSRERWRGWLELSGNDVQEPQCSTMKKKEKNIFFGEAGGANNARSHGK